VPTPPGTRTAAGGLKAGCLDFVLSSRVAASHAPAATICTLRASKCRRYACYRGDSLELWTCGNSGTWKPPRLRAPRHKDLVSVRAWRTRDRRDRPSREVGRLEQHRGSTDRTRRGSGRVGPADVPHLLGQPEHPVGGRRRDPMMSQQSDSTRGRAHQALPVLRAVQFYGPVGWLARRALEPRSAQAQTPAPFTPTGRNLVSREYRPPSARPRLGRCSRSSSCLP